MKNGAFFALLGALLLPLAPASWAASREANPHKSSDQCYTRQDLSARAPGFLAKVYVKDGDLVKAGDILAEMDHRLLSATVKEAEAGVAAAKAQLSLAEDAHSRLEKMAASASEQELFGAKVKVEQARAQLAQAQAVRGKARIQLSDAFIKAKVDGRVSGLPRVKDLFVQAGRPLGHVEATTTNCSASVPN